MENTTSQESKYDIIEDIEIPEGPCKSWQITVDLLAEALQVPAGLIMRVHPREIEVFLRSRNPENLYKPGETADLNTGLYCETVMDTRRELLVSNALADPVWDHNPDIELGMISYLGLPLLWPTGHLFGTICVLDDKENSFSKTYRGLLEQFRDLVQWELATVYEHHILRDKEKREFKVRKALTDLAKALTTPNVTIEGITRIILEYAKHLTGSEHGYVSIIDEQTGDNIGYTLTDMFGKACRVPAGENRISFPRGSDGLYPKLWGHSLNTGKAFFTNSPADHPASKGTPEGHVPLRNFLSVPAMRGDERLGQIALANSPRDYDDNDLHTVQRLAPLFSVAIGRKKIEEILQKSEERLALALEASGAGIYDHAVPINIGSYHSKRWADILGYTRDELPPPEEIEPWLFARVHPDDLPGLKKAHLDCIEGRAATYDVEFRVRHKSEEWIWVQGLSRAVERDGEGTAKRIVGVMLDRTEYKQAEQKNAEMQAQFVQAQKLEALGTLAGGIAHDFNNILSLIFGNSELALLGVENGTDVRENIQAVMKAGTRARDLVKQILTFARQTAEEKQPVRISSIAKEALKLLRASLPTTIEIRESLASNATVMADPTQIHQILMNLCTNAKLAMPEGGVLTVELTEKELDEAFDKRRPGADPCSWLRLTVRDTGTGMTPEVMQRIFEPFFTTREYGAGTGMGLAVVHGIVKDCDGTVTVDSEPGKGSTFHVFLPICKAAEVREEEEEKPLPTGTERILFVDDEEVIVTLATAMLQSFGYAVTATTNSLEALEVFRAASDAFDLIITDMTMPGLSGDDLARQILQIRKDIPILLCTGFSERMDEEAARAIGIKGFLMKPVSMKTLAGETRKALDLTSPGGTGPPRRTGPG